MSLTNVGLGIQFEFATSVFAFGPLAEGALVWPQIGFGLYYATGGRERPAEAGPTPEDEEGVEYYY